MPTTPKAPFIMLAPMEGVIDVVVRRLFSQIGGFDRLVTEFIRVTDRVHSPEIFYKRCPELKSGGRTAEGTPVFVQLLGGNAEMIAANAALVSELGAPGIDLNFGCPAPTVNRHDGGATLLKNPDRVFQVVSAVRRAVPAHIPVTAKVRLGFSSKDLALDIARAADTAGAATLTVHARTRDEKYVPPAHWEYIAMMKSVVHSAQVIANGEIWSVDDYRRCVEVSGCPDVALGRGAIARPDLALQIKAEAPAWPWQKLYNDYVTPFVRDSENYRGPEYTVARTKQMLKGLAVRNDEATVLFERVKRLNSIHDVRAALEMT